MLIIFYEASLHEIEHEEPHSEQKRTEKRSNDSLLDERRCFLFLSFSLSVTF